MAGGAAGSGARVAGEGAGERAGAVAWTTGVEMALAGARPHATSAELAGASGLAGAFGFGSALAALLAPPATAVIWQSIPTVLWIACRRFSAWSARPKAPANPVVLNDKVRTWPSKAPTWALGSTSAHVLRLILESVCRTSGQARRRTSTSPVPAAPVLAALVPVPVAPVGAGIAGAWPTEAGPAGAGAAAGALTASGPVSGVG